MTLSLTTRSQHTGQSWVRSRTSFQGSSHPTLDKCRLKVCNPGILLTPMYEQFSSGTHFWKHNHHNPLVFSSQKCDVFILLSDFTFLFGMVDAYLSGKHPTFPTIRLCPHLEVLTHGQFRLCSTGTHSHQSAQAFYQSLPGNLKHSTKTPRKNSPPKKTKMVVNDTDSEASFFFGIWVALGVL